MSIFATRVILQTVMNNRDWSDKAIFTSAEMGQICSKTPLKDNPQKVAVREAATSPTAEIKSARPNCLKQENNTYGCNAQGVLEETIYG